MGCRARCLMALMLVFSVDLSLASGMAWEPFPAFPSSASGRTDAVAIFHQDILYVLGGQPYRCEGGAACADPELGAADYLPSGGSVWLQGQPFDDRLQRLGGGVDGLGRPVGFGGSQGDGPVATDRTFFYDILLGDQTEPSLARKNFTHTNFAWAVDDLGRLYAIGGGPGPGASAGSPNVTDVERYDAGSDTWTVLASLPGARANAAAVYDGQGHLLVFGGYNADASSRATDVLSYDIASDVWTVLGPLPMPAFGSNDFSDQRAALGADGKVYIVGGINGPVGAGSTRSQVYTYEPVTSTWGTAPDLTVPRHGTALALDDDGWLYALGGRNGTSGLSSNERFDTTPGGGECLVAADCADGLACNGDEFCVDGICLAGNPVECAEDEFCAAGGICRLHRYDIVDLGELLGGASGTANAVDPTGRVVGEYFDATAGEWHGFLYDGTMHDLGTGRARAISDDGWIVGEDGTAFAIDPSGVRTDLGTLGGAASAAYGVNAGGWVVGQSDTVASADHAFLVRGPGADMEDLGTLGDYSIAHGIDPSGMIVGESLVTYFDPHAEPFQFDSSMAGAVMEVMPVPFPAGSARAINDLGHATGWVANHVDNWGDAFVFDGIATTTLGDVPGKAHSIGTAINNSDQVVGYAFGEWVDTVCCGQMWSNSIHRAYFHDGVGPVNLNDELPESTDWVLTVATGINDDGTIVGTGNRDGVGRPFMMIPRGSDQDGDGVPDLLDNCPVDFNDQADSDGDGAGDSCDAFPSDPLEQFDTDGDMIGNNADLDDDGDGLFDVDETGVYGTDPLLYDTDGDSIDDGHEVDEGTDPNNANSLPADGDVNNDDVIDLADVLLARRIQSGARLPSKVEAYHCDVAPLINGIPVPDGKIDAADVLLIQRKYLRMVNF